ncbi:MAG TPA: ABC transporter substrate-binding protein [Candidatus Dormibacteraeota bacterium]|nr:ABC transporter substrate-binding protein [Candidatus Dormibacteraeota bacterium]
MALGLTLAACGSSSSGTGNGASAPGVSANSITIGVILSQTGFYAAEGGGFFKSFKAVVDAQNDKGGVNNRKINLVIQNDQSTVAANLSAAKSLVETQNAFMVVDISGTQPSGGQYLSQKGVPVVAAPVDVSVSTYSTFFAPNGGLNPNPKVTNTTSAEMFKSLGVKKVGSLGLTVSVASQNSATAAVDAAGQAGLEKGYINTTVQVGNTNWTAYVLGFKNSNTDGYQGAMDTPDTLSFLTAAQQQGVSLTSIQAQLYINQYLTGPTAAVMQGMYAAAQWDPVLTDAPVKQEIDTLNKYGDPTQAPDNWTSSGYTMGLLLIKALEVAGQNPTRQAVLTNLRAVTNWDAGGLAPQPIDLSKEISDPPASGACAWLVKAQGQTFSPVSNTPVCTQKITLP